MHLKCLMSLSISLVVVFTGCAIHRNDNMTLPEPRPLGKDYESYMFPLEPSQVSSALLKLEEPTGTITLSQTLSLALMENLDLAAFSWEVRAGEARILQASLYPNPELEVEVENFGGSREQENPDGTVNKLKRFDGAETTIQFSQLILLAGKRSKRKKVAALERDLVGWDYETKRLDVFTEVTKAFVDLLAMQERLSLAEDLVRLSEEVFNIVSERVKAGKVSPVEETKARVALSIIRIERERVRRELEAARKRLAASWGCTSPTFQKVKGELEDIAPIPAYEHLANRISQNPDLARWTTELEQRQAALNMEKADRFPDLTIGGGVRYLDESEDQTYVMGLSIPLPLFDRNQGNIFEAQYSLAKAEKERSAAEVRIRTALHKAYQVLSTAFTETTALKNDVLPGVQSAFDAAKEGYREGKFGYLDVLDAQRSLFDAKGQYIEALATYHKAVATMERLIGKGFDAIKNPPE